MDRLTMTVQEMATQLGISKPKAYELTRIKGFPVLRLGRRVIIPVEAFHRWMDEQSKSS